jgi:hypothetical protein
VATPLILGANFQFAFTQRAAAVASMGGPEPSASVITPLETCIVTRTLPVMCICKAWGGYCGAGERIRLEERGPPVPVPPTTPLGLALGGFGPCGAAGAFGPVGAGGGFFTSLLGVGDGFGRGVLSGCGTGVGVGVGSGISNSGGLSKGGGVGSGSGGGVGSGSGGVSG